SQDLCFVGQNDYRDFLKEADPTLFNPGPILNLQGKELGIHNGLVEYTIGQRKGVGISASEPYYVINKDLQNNTLIIGTKSEMGQQRFLAHQINWIDGDTPDQPFQAAVRIRYQSRAVPGLVTPMGPDRAEINLTSPLPDITPGQAAVFYQDQICLGGGIIQVEEE
ncbi:MAG: tRNA 2-thiouridine(34) synthase MnmA, partial [Chloroflexi bacterium]|nr:tRNA 2-thiouridine(34) synthase MnmA [Chloroflexota bacterium]